MSDGGGGCLRTLGIIALIVAVWLGVVTVNQGGVKTADHSETLTWSGWAPSGEAPGRQAVAIAKTAVPAGPSLPPAATYAPQPTYSPQPTYTPLPSQRPHVVVQHEPAPTEPPAWGDPTGYTAASMDVTPWEVLGWLLVGLVPSAGLAGLGLGVYRHVALTRARVATIGGGGQQGTPPQGERIEGPPIEGPAPGGDPAQGSDPLPDGTTQAGDGRPVDVAEYLGREV